ncbi:hypothetical protein SDC9_83661 [bioreactor metagenome]|uniref:Uncharacterized protein n=1 Tax=bioreactor metagenome TaxID=1076179 RepID=A0A644Z863_9ZZZZ
MEAVLDKDRVASIKTVCPKHNKYLYSLAKNPAFGVRLSAAAVRQHRKAFPGDPVPGEIERAPSKRKNSESIVCRSTKKRKAEFLRAIKDDGFPDMQTGLSSVIETYLQVGKQRDELLTAFKSDGFPDIPSGIKWLVEMYLIRRKSNGKVAEG